MTPEGAGPRRILLVDCDAFFVQVARLEDPEGAGTAELLLVGGSPEGRGVVTSASYPAREYGVRSAMPMARAVRLCPGATVVPVPREACAERSRRIRRLLREMAPVVEAASIDEFYLDLTGTERLFGTPDLGAVARRFRRRILEEAEVSVSVGGASCRLVAKMAVSEAKPAGVHVVPPGEEEAFLRRFELADIPGVGPALVETLRSRGLRSVDDALGVDEETLRSWLGERRGPWLYRRVRGIDPTPVSPEADPKSVSHERTFPEDIDDDGELEDRLLALVVETGASLRAKGLRARTITVKIRDSDFRTRQSSHTVPAPVESDPAIHAVARGLLRELREARPRPARLLGVGVSNFVSGDSPVQLALFGGEAALESEEERTLARVVDDLRERFGSDALLPGRILPGRGRGTDEAG